MNLLRLYIDNASDDTNQGCTLANSALPTEMTTIAVSATKGSFATSRVPIFSIVEGRKFVEPGKYILPTDEDESDRLLIQHVCLRNIFRGNFQSPVEDVLQRGAKVLDVGCGPGVWSMEMSHTYRNSTFIGTDLANVVPNRTLPNCSFQAADTTRGLPFPDNTFDFVFQRLLATAFTPEQWKFVMQELIRVCKPGGFVELVECDLLDHNLGPNYTRWNNAVIAALKSRGIDTSQPRHLASLLEGLEHVSSDYHSFPIAWNGRLGELVAQNSRMTFASFKPHVKGLIGCNDTEYEMIAEKAIMEAARVGTWGNIYYAYGRKRGDTGIVDR